jgi:drug/metabolite transporter (DMT)-like permease
LKEVRRMRFTRRGAAVGLLLLVGLLWSAVGPMAQVVQWDLALHNAVRSAAAALMAAALIRRRPRAIDLTPVGVGAIIRMVITSPLFVVSASLGDPNVAICLIYTSPMWRALAAQIFCGRKPTHGFYTRFTMLMVGMMVLGLPDLSKGSPVGLVAGLLSGISWGTWSLLHELRARREPDAAPTDLLVGFIAAACGFGIAALLMPVPRDLAHVPSLVGTLGAGALVGSALFVIARAHRVLSGASVLLIGALEVPCAIAWAFALLGLVPSLHQIVGGAIVVLCVLWEGIASGRE